MLWTYHVLQERDRQHQWMGRMHRIDGAGLSAIAFHEPKRLEEERRSALNDAAPKNDADVVARALRMIDSINAGHVFADGPSDRILVS